MFQTRTRVADGRAGTGGSARTLLPVSCAAARTVGKGELAHSVSLISSFIFINAVNTELSSQHVCFS